MSAAHQLSPAEEQAFEFLRANYYIVNRRHCIVGCLPPGKTGTQALGEASGNAQYANQISEEEAGDQYLRFHGFEQNMWVELPSDAFSAFVRAGGRRYLEPPKSTLKKGTKR